MAVRAQIVLDLITGPFASKMKQAQQGWGGFRKSVFSMRHALQATFAGYAMTRAYQFGRDAIKSAEEGAVAEAGLVGAMKAKGIYTRSAANELLRYASAVQSSTTFQDEQVVGIMRSLSGYGLQGEQLKRATATVLDWTAAGQSMEGTTEGIGKAFVGNMKSVGMWGIKTKDAEGKALDFAAVLENIGARWRGTAQELTKTDFGALRQMANIAGDMKESFGTGLATGLVSIVRALNDAGPGLAQWNSGWSKFMALKTEEWVERFGSGLRALATWIPGLHEGGLAQAEELANKALTARVYAEGVQQAEAGRAAWERQKSAQELNRKLRTQQGLAKIATSGGVR